MILFFPPPAASNILYNNHIMSLELSAKTELGGIYNLPGEGFVVELQHGDATYLFDKQGLQHRILAKKRQGLPADAEENALFRINSFRPTLEE